MSAANSDSGFGRYRLLRPRWQLCWGSRSVNGKAVAPRKKTAIAQQLSARALAPKIVLGAQPVAADDLEYRRVSIKGEFVRGWTVYLDNRPYQGRPGFFMY
ncbi:SURF1 family cytochrome oxidase biogenesis protein [Undibacterium arcticum]